MTQFGFPLEEAARHALGDPLFTYLMGAPADAANGFEDRNAADLAGWRFCPRVLTGQTGVDMTTPFAGRAFAAPLGIGAFAGDLLFHSEGLKPLARVAQRLNLPMVISEETVTPLSELTALHDSCWLQLRAAGDLGRIERLVSHAAEAGVQGMVFTVLAPTHPVPGLQPGAFSVGAEIARRGWTTIGATEPGVAALPSFPAWGTTEMASVIRLCKSLGLPVLLKGILHPEDARLSETLGASGIVASNIGLRQSARWVGAAEQLPALREASTLPVVFDGGIRNGSDLALACCLGSQLSLVARPLVTALAGGGEAAVEALLRSQIDQLCAMTAWLGAGSPAALGRHHIQKKEAL